MDSNPPNRRSLADVMVSLTMTCIAVALIRFATASHLPSKPAVAIDLVVCFWPGLLAASIAATTTCVAGWRQGLRWAVLWFAALSGAMLLWGLAYTYWPN